MIRAFAPMGENLTQREPGREGFWFAGKTRGAFCTLSLRNGLLAAMNHKQRRPEAKSPASAVDWGRCPPKLPSG